MKLPKIIIDYDEGSGNDFTTFIVIQVTSNKASLPVLATVLEFVFLDLRGLSPITKDEFIQKEVRRLSTKYNK
jgi:hypothetical protein